MNLRIKSKMLLSLMGPFAFHWMSQTCFLVFTQRKPWNSQELSDFKWSTHTYYAECKFLGIALEQNFFQFSKQIYKQLNGPSMGSSLSPFLAETLMNHFEKTFLVNKIFLHKIIFHYRYVDESCILFFDAKIDFIIYFVEYINKIHTLSSKWIL